MDLIQTIDIAASGMTAQRTRLNVISMNLANANTTRTDDGTPYRRKTTIFQACPIGYSFQNHLRNALEGQIYGVRVTEIVPVPGELKKIFDPSHPDADKEGYVYLPNVNLVQEMVQMLNANRAYEANAAAIRAAKEMALKALEIGR
ncbi:MAG: flagellar basal body rod protein FlgC [Deltaproteobacteria bacterium]|nr:flagellar basal body rod protein FlgC [Deltaproteobacteria bacterium]MBW1863205.1 flagellar basal body rod protein FlgC [Deltaproteobacteria bacterium]